MIGVRTPNQLNTMQAAKRITILGTGALALFAFSTELLGQSTERAQTKQEGKTKSSVKAATKTEAETTPLWQFKLKGIGG